MKTRTLERIAPFLAVLRRYSALREVRPAAFHFDGKDFIHFHETEEGVVADVRLTRGWIRMPVSTQAEQSELLDQLDDTLASLESHAHGRPTR